MQIEKQENNQLDVFWIIIALYFPWNVWLWVISG